MLTVNMFHKNYTFECYILNQSLQAEKRTTYQYNKCTNAAISTIILGNLLCHLKLPVPGQ